MFLFDLLRGANLLISIRKNYDTTVMADDNTADVFIITTDC